MCVPYVLFTMAPRNNKRQLPCIYCRIFMLGTVYLVQSTTLAAAVFALIFFFFLFNPILLLLSSPSFAFPILLLVLVVTQTRGHMVGRYPPSPPLLVPLVPLRSSVLSRGDNSPFSPRPRASNCTCSRYEGALSSWFLLGFANK